MKVFVTGATGFIGSAVVKELLAHGHTVLGLARNDDAAAKLKAAGVEIHRGDLTDHASLIAGAAKADAVAHLGFIHDFSRLGEVVQIDRQAVQAIADSLHGTNKPFVVTFGTATLKPGSVLTENDTPIAEAYPRAHTERVVLDAAKHGVRSAVLRLPPTVHGRGDHGFVPILIDIAKKSGVSAFVGDGANRWPAVHRADAAKLYRLAIEKAEPGTIIHATAEEGVPFRDIAETIGEGLSLPVRGLPEADAAKHFDWFIKFASNDGPTSSAITRQRFNWTPTEPGLLQDLRENGYFN